MIYSGIGRDDYLLAFVVDKGYIETDSFDICTMTAEYLGGSPLTGAKLIGKIEAVRLASGDLVYRQRLVIQSITRILTICKKLDFGVCFPEGFRVGISQFEYVGDSIGMLSKYYVLYHQEYATLEDWLKNSFLLQFRILLELNGIRYFLDCGFEDDKTIDCLYRSPYVACSVDKYTKISSVLDLGIDKIKYNNKPLFSKERGRTAGYYTDNGTEKELFISGYSKRNIREDRQRGAFIIAS
jgi:hypothetical protein